MSVEQMTRVFKFSASKGTARLVLLALADVANPEGEVTAYARSQRRLAKMANCDTASVSRAIKKLAEIGELEVLEVGDGRASSNYRLLVPDAEAPQIEAPQDAPPGGADCGPRGDDPRGQAPQDAPPIIPSSPDDPPSLPENEGADAPGALFHVEHDEPEADDPAARPLAPGERVPEFEFTDWYRIYPLHKARGAAEKAYAAARRKVTAAVLADGAAAYAAEQARPLRSGEFRPATCHPATWLNQERWADEASAARAGTPAGPKSGSGWAPDASSGRVQEGSL